MPVKKTSTKKCFNCCPQCGATDPDIIWGEKEFDGMSYWQGADCKKCSCSFTEVYTYDFTEKVIDDSNSESNL